jgi:hypothetical protein
MHLWNPEMGYLNKQLGIGLINRLLNANFDAKLKKKTVISVRLALHLTDNTGPMFLFLVFSVAS